MLVNVMNLSCLLEFTVDCLFNKLIDLSSHVFFRFFVYFIYCYLQMLFELGLKSLGVDLEFR